MRKTTIVLQLSLLMLTQTISYRSISQVLSQDSIKSQVLREWTRAKVYTNSYLNTMPVDKYELRATDSVRTFAQQMLHLASGNVFLMSMATDDVKPVWAGSDIEHRASASSKDSVAYYVNSSYDYCYNAINSMPVNKWGEMVKTRFGIEISRFALMLKSFEHQTHHRGQTTVYIRLAGVKPPNEQLF